MLSDEAFFCADDDAASLAEEALGAEVDTTDIVDVTSVFVGGPCQFGPLASPQ